MEGFGAFCGLLLLENGTRLELQSFQREFLGDYFAGATETTVLLPKKNGKTTVLAALALHHILTTPDAECIIAAASRDQAQILLGQMQGFIRRTAGLGSRLLVKQREVRCRDGSGRARVMAADADTADGVLPTLALVDELHRHRSAELYGVFRDGLGPRDGRMVTISTAGDDELSPLGKVRSAAYLLPDFERVGAYRRARSADGSFVWHEWALDAAEDRSDMGVVAAANPAPWHTEESLRRRFESPSTTPWQWARFACGVWMQGEDSAIASEDWAGRAVPGLVIPDGTQVWLGIDLGWKWDTTALVPLWWVSEEDRRFGAPTVIVPPRDGTSTDPEVIQDAILEVHGRTPVHTVVLDPNAGGEQLAAWIERNVGARVVALSQDPAPMSVAAQRFTEAIREGTMTHPSDDTFTAHVLAARAKTTSGEKWKFVKHRRPIDALIAAAMVHSVAADNPVHDGPLVEWA